MNLDAHDRAGYAIALEQARLGAGEGGVPIGSSIFQNGKLLGAGRNRRVQNGDPTAHGEIDALRKVGRRASYAGTTLYSTLAPCAMCAGSIILFGIPRVVVGEDENFPGELELLRSRGVDVVVIDDPKATALMESFITEYPALWNEDIGVEEN
ncbi:nucleoside deaminase [Paeniglutamicibacter terrestris]|uniref:Nucleoside deaminase n=1 Tax=Paeniglutamicibacter terrestris TaxID=2723403 RepID=A0ABX1G7Y3_9MICC|nr:nucleoside deaminase [Paeniglutamicibacter terrestris]ASN40431.1 tRNA-specific adenosine deaminase [Arthrobacter sp. 7749]NKG21671.1 nucleoside deaminase [Paeniglutamicibacter terrestris]